MILREVLLGVGFILLGSGLAMAIVPRPQTGILVAALGAAMIVISIVDVGPPTRKG